MEGVIFITTLSLFHLFRNSQYPEKSSVFFTNFFRECEYIRSCYLLKSSNLLKKSFKKTSHFVLTVTGVLEKSVLLADQNPWQILVKKFNCIVSIFVLFILLSSLLVYLSRILTANSRIPFLQNSPTSCVCSLWYLSRQYIICWRRY